MASDISVERNQYLALMLSQNGNESVDSSCDEEIHFPPWYDADRFQRGQRFIRKCLASSFFGMLLGLISILAIPSILQVLICTRNSGTGKNAYRRYVATIYHATLWIDTEMLRGSKSWQSLEAVRRKHFIASKFCGRAQKIVITQRDMAITQFGFAGFMILNPKSIGVHIESQKDMEDTVYFWRVIGYMVGIKDEFNLCTASLEESTRRAKTIREQFIRPNLETPFTEFQPMTRALTNGLWHYSLYMNNTAVSFVTKRLAGCKGYEYFDSEFDQPPTEIDRHQMEYYKCSIYERFLITFFIYIQEYQMKYSLLRWYLNFEVRRLAWTNYYFPISAILAYGVDTAYVRLFHRFTPTDNKNKQ